MNILPDELLIEIFSYLRCEDLVLSVPFVSKRWESLSKCREIWERVKYIPSGELNDIITVLKNAALLRSVIIEYNANVQKTVSTLCVYCQNLCDIEIWWDAVSPNLLEEFFKQFPSLESFSMCLNSVNGARCIELLSQCLHLKKLALHVDCWGYTLIDLKCIADGCPQLTHLDLQNILLDKSDLDYLLQKKKQQLKSLQLNGHNLSSETLHILSSCKNLESLTLIVKSHHVTNAELQAIASLSQLKNLSLIGLWGIPYDSMANFFKSNCFSNLVLLDLSEYDYFNRKLARVILNYCPNIKHLIISNCFEGSIRGLREMLKIKKLEMLELQGWNIFPRGCMKQLLSCSILQELNLSGCALRDVHVSQIITCLKLHYFNVSSCLLLTDRALKFFPKCTTLHTLMLDNCHFTGECVLQMLLNMSLSVISIQNCHEIKPEAITQIEKLVIRIYS